MSNPDTKKETAMTNRTEAIARVCHEANRAYCQTIGDDSQVAWLDAPEWQRASALKGVAFCIDNPDAPPSANHDSWLDEKRATGWTYGPVKDAEKKEHPCFVPYEDLPVEQRAKDALFKAVVAALTMSNPDTPEQADAITAYVEHHERCATEKETDAPCSAEMHRMQARYTRETRHFPRADEWPIFEAWCKAQWETD